MAANLLVGDIHADLGNANPIYGLADTEKVSLSDAIAASKIAGL